MGNFYCPALVGPFPVLLPHLLGGEPWDNSLQAPLTPKPIPKDSCAEEMEPSVCCFENGLDYKSYNVVPQFIFKNTEKPKKKIKMYP